MYHSFTSKSHAKLVAGQPADVFSKVRRAQFRLAALGTVRGLDQDIGLFFGISQSLTFSYPATA